MLLSDQNILIDRLSESVVEKLFIYVKRRHTHDCVTDYPKETKIM